MTDRFPAPHAQHDLLLVAAHADGDLTAADRTRAEALLGDCADCAQIAADLQAIARATAALPAPARTREFTLRPEHAARLRPRGWRRLAAALGTTRLELARPLAPALVTLGLVGLLVSGLPLFQAGGWGFLGFAASGAASAPAASAAPAPAAAPVGAAPSAAASSGSEVTGGAKGSPVALSSPAPARDGLGTVSGPQASPSAVTDTAGEASGAPRVSTAPPGLNAGNPSTFEAPGPNLPLAAVSALLLVLGLVLFGLRRALRRIPGH